MKKIKIIEKANPKQVDQVVLVIVILKNMTVEIMEVTSHCISFLYFIHLVIILM